MTIRPEMSVKKRFHVHIPYPVLLERLDYIVAQGINPEVYIDGEVLDSAESGDLKEIKEACAVAGLELTLHGPYADLNPGSPDESVRLATIERYKRAFWVASYLRPKTIVLHAGYNERRFKGDAGLWLSQSRKTWPQFIKEAERRSTVIVVENIFEKEPSTLKTLVEAFNSPSFRVCIDSGHLNVFSSVGMEAWFSSIGPFIAEAHLHDNKGGGDEHLPLGEGAIDFGLFLRLLSQYAKDPVLTIEPHGEEMVKRGIIAFERVVKDL
jgi:sugar phosphate isomerase/epimerase